MKSLPNIQQRDPRSLEQRRADEVAADGAWDGFETEELLTEEGALELLSHSRALARANAAESNGVLGHAAGQPFRWKNKVYRITRCDYTDGEAVVEATPDDADFKDEVKRRVESDRFHTLNYYHGYGFICFPEDYAKYQD